MGDDYMPAARPQTPASAAANAEESDAYAIFRTCPGLISSDRELVLVQLEKRGGVRIAEMHLAILLSVSPGFTV
jgi:hypothetical protein